MKTPFKLLSFTCAFVLLMSCNSDFGGLSGNYMSDNMKEEQPTEKYKDYDENQFIKVSDQAISTFSVDADGGAGRDLAAGDLYPHGYSNGDPYSNRHGDGNSNGDTCAHGDSDEPSSTRRG